METKKCILVVDDEPGILRFVSTSLGLAGYEVIVTTNGDEALQIARSRKPDIMLLDILMQPVTGFEVLDRLRTFSRIPAIVFTAQTLIAEQAVKLGANGHISKPFRPEELLKKIEEVLAEKPEPSGQKP